MLTWRNIALNEKESLVIFAQQKEHINTIK